MAMKDLWLQLDKSDEESDSSSAGFNFNFVGLS